MWKQSVNIPEWQPVPTSFCIGDDTITIGVKLDKNILQSKEAR